MNIYFELTRELNALGPIVALGSGQAVVHYRLALASKDGDWIVREESGVCERILAVLGARQARYRLSAPLDLRWLKGGWSSHFQFLIEDRLRVRCDFFSRPPRITLAELDVLFRAGSDPMLAGNDPVLAGSDPMLAGSDPMLVIGLEPLVRMKQTQRAKDYAIIGGSARLLPPERELELSTDPDRIIELAKVTTFPSERPCVVAARSDADPERVELELVREMRRMRQLDAARVQSYARAAEPYLAALMKHDIDKMALSEAHTAAIELADRLLPTDPRGLEDVDANAQ